MRHSTHELAHCAALIAEGATGQPQKKEKNVNKTNQALLLTSWFGKEREREREKKNPGLILPVKTRDDLSSSSSLCAVIDEKLQHSLGLTTQYLQLGP